MKKKDKQFLLKLLKRLDSLYEAEDEVYQLVRKHDRRNDQVFLSYSNILNAIYYVFRNQTANEAYDSFDSPGAPTGKPVAWYKTIFNTKSDNYIKGPRVDNNNNATGYIPDCIDDVILNSKLSPSKKLNVLTRMFKDLKTIERQVKK